MSYKGVMKLAKEHPRSKPSEWHPNGIDWLTVVKACYEEAQERKGSQFAGAWVQERVNFIFPGLRFLTKYGILEKVGEAVRAGTRAYYIMPEINGVGKALGELGYLRTK